jgi:hypothetical protein
LPFTAACFALPNAASNFSVSSPFDKKSLAVTGLLFLFVWLLLDNGVVVLFFGTDDDELGRMEYNDVKFLGSLGAISWTKGMIHVSGDATRDRPSSAF